MIHISDIGFDTQEPNCFEVAIGIADTHDFGGAYSGYGLALTQSVVADLKDNYYSNTALGQFCRRGALLSQVGQVYQAPSPNRSS